MTDLAYMVREDWAQHGTAMVPSSARIREWLGAGPVLFAVVDVKQHTPSGHNADVEAADYIAPERAKRHVVNINELRRLDQRDRTADLAVVVLHPFKLRDCETLREVVDSGALSRAVVLIWSPRDTIRTWLNAQGAVDLHAEASMPAPDPLLVAAAKLMVNEQYNGLSSGRGKDVVVQLLRAFDGSGYPLDEDAWLRAFFAAGGSFSGAEPVAKFVREMKSGVRHRVKPVLRDEIVDILRKDVTAK